MSSHFIRYIVGTLIKLVICFIQAKTKQLELLDKHFELLKWEYEVKEKRFDKLVSARNELKFRFSRAIQEVHNKAATKTDILERTVTNLEMKVGGPNELAVSYVTLFSRS